MHGKLHGLPKKVLKFPVFIAYCRYRTSLMKRNRRRLVLLIVVGILAIMPFVVRHLQTQRTEGVLEQLMTAKRDSIAQNMRKRLHDFCRVVL